MSRLLSQTPLSLFPPNFCNTNGFSSSPPLLRRNLHFSLSATTDSPPSPISSTHYLLTSLSLPPEFESVLAVHDRPLPPHSTANADSVLALFQSFEFSPFLTASILSRCPSLLSFHPLTNLRPKLQFFLQIGFSADALSRLLAAQPRLLKLSLALTLSPSLTFLLPFFGGDTETLVSALSAKHGVLALRAFSHSQSMALNLRALRECGVPDAHIVRMMTDRRGIVTLSLEEQEFGRIVREAREIGFDPSKMSFIHCVSVTLNRERLAAKFDLLMSSFGWTDSEVEALLAKQYKFFNSSEERLRMTLDFFMNKLKWTPRDIIKYPAVMQYSFENRILPRASVLDFLMSKGIVKGKRVGWTFQLNDDLFLSKFVNGYAREFPELLEMYQSQNMECQDSASS